MSVGLRQGLRVLDCTRTGTYVEVWVELTELDVVDGQRVATGAVVLGAKGVKTDLMKL